VLLLYCVIQREEGDVKTLNIELSVSSSKIHLQDTKVYKQWTHYYSKQKKTVIFFIVPSNLAVLLISILALPSWGVEIAQHWRPA
jgi:hypothetical protein